MRPNTVSIASRCGNRQMLQALVEQRAAQLVKAAVRELHLGLDPDGLRNGPGGRLLREMI
jgi:hypothetical protein